MLLSRGSGNARPRRGRAARTGSRRNMTAPTVKPQPHQLKVLSALALRQDLARALAASFSSCHLGVMFYRDTLINSCSLLEKCHKSMQKYIRGGLCKDQFSKWFAKYKWVMRDTGNSLCSLWGHREKSSQAECCSARTESPEMILEQ